MSLQDTFEEREFGPHRDDRWEEADVFTAPEQTKRPDSFDLRRPIAIAEARLQAEKAYIDIVHQAEADLL